MLTDSNQLFAVALFTIVALTITLILHLFYGLNPILNTSLNSALALVWAVSFSLLSWWSSGTLSHVCNVDNWDSDLGISVCRLYKALFSFALLGFVSTLLALGLDIRVQKTATRRGRFQQLDTLGSDGKRDAHVSGHEYEEHDANLGVSTTQRDEGRLARGGEGYAVPEEQFTYEESTAYHGACGQLEQRH